MAVLEWIQTGLDTLGLGYDIFGNERNYRDNKENIEWERERYLETRDYERALQQQIFDREDTAIQRAVQDAGKAGLSPLSVAGGNGAGAGAIVGMSQAPSASTAPFQQLEPLDLVSVVRSAQEMALAQDANDRANKQVDAEIAFQNANLALERERFGMEFALRNAEMFNNIQLSSKKMEQEQEQFNRRLLADTYRYNQENRRWFREFQRQGVWREQDIERFENQFKWQKGEDTIDNIMNFGNLLGNILQYLNGNRR